jgi:Ni,Fe-hydrogenase III small subunit
MIVVKFWIFQGIKNGILTTKYPAHLPTNDEIPVSSIPPTAPAEAKWGDGETVCPTGAIKAEPKRQLDLGKCIYCKRCANAGFSSTSGNSETDRRNAMQSIKTSSTESTQNIVKDWLQKRTVFRRSLHIMMIDVGSCNACNLEVLNLSNPYYDLTRLGIFFTNSPKHADALVVVGALNSAMVEVLKRTYESMSNPKVVISIGACAISGGIFYNTESFVSPIQDIIPVDVSIPGCPPTPIQILEGLLLIMGKIGKTLTVGRSHEDAGLE